MLFAADKYSVGAAGNNDILHSVAEDGCSQLVDDVGVLGLLSEDDVAYCVRR